MSEPEGLHLAKGLTLPVDAVTQTVAILARKRSGKSYTARRLAEQLYRAGLQIVVVDPKGDWWGMRSSADGKGPGLSVIILGGEHGDIPLEVGGGEIVAKLVVEERASVLLDLSLFRKHEVATFMTAFGENLYRLKAREAFRTPLMLLIDEADAIAPQKPQHGEERMLGAMEDIVRRGGQRGIGCTFVTQRSAVLNKNVLTQAQVLVAMRTIAPQDLKAMDAWIEVHGTPEQRSTLMESLPSLPQGDAWFWSPGWPGDEGIFRRVHVARIETFDSGATPKPGEQRVEPKQRAAIDLEALRRQMLATVERAKAEDPRELKREIAALRKQLKDQPQVLDVRTMEAARAEAYARGRRDGLAVGQKTVSALAAAIERANGELAGGSREVAIPAPRPPVPAIRARRTTPMPEATTNGKLASGERRILTILRQYEDRGRTKVQLAIMAGYASNGGGYGNYLSHLRGLGFIGGRGDRLTITPEGLATVGDGDPLPIGSALFDEWRGKLAKAERLILEYLQRVYPEESTKDEIAAATGYEPAGGGFGNALSRLRTLDLVVGAGGRIRLADELAGDA
jgi:hypothetical protein